MDHDTLQRYYQITLEHQLTLERVLLEHATRLEAVADRIEKAMAQPQIRVELPQLDIRLGGGDPIGDKGAQA